MKKLALSAFSTLGRKRIRLDKFVFIWFLTLVLSGGAIHYFLGNASTVEDILASRIEPVSCIIFIDGTMYYAKNGTTGQIVYYGANASTIFNNALSTLGSSGGTLYIKAGTYAISNSVNIPSNVQVIGEGWNVNLCPTVNANVISISDAHSVRIAHLSIRDLNNAQASTYAIFADSCSFSTFEDIYIDRCYSGIGFRSLSNPSNQARNNRVTRVYISEVDSDGINLGANVHDNVFHDIYVFRATGNGIVSIQTGGTIVGGNEFSKVRVAECGQGFNFTDTRELWFSDCLADSNSCNGFVFAGYVTHVYIENCLASLNSENNIKLDGNSTHYIKQVMIKNTVLNMAGGHGLFGDYLESVSVNVISMLNNMSGIMVINSTRMIIQGTFKDNSQYNMGAYDGVALSAVTYSVISGSQSFDDQGMSMTQRYGIHTDSTSDHNIIANNNCYRNQHATTDIVYGGSNDLVIFNVGRYTPQNSSTTTMP